MKRLAILALIGVTSYAVTWLVLDWLSWRWLGHPERACKMCGCTDVRACPGGCYLVAEGFCSRCVFGAEAEPGGGWQG